MPPIIDSGIDPSICLTNDLSDTLYVSRKAVATLSAFSRYATKTHVHPSPVPPSVSNAWVMKFSEGDVDMRKDNIQI